ncbi:MAG: hypothetical protein A2070_00010 [Bdellovibrionales bacterium GWC1_52_8]|nr:MAG: hypothetical protein A2Z97_00090 [Bdellovibrionales bacterium GWB1_52_6]OFZ04111.1 MAG: hypothetical protein A2X97_15025 [Bdellovibrionales bacterium GWA1_52_35]OFZ36952.1 MAG: hypothetical protein A2070_00010 [Bdellovibrionales bacterium GWC1_52_8]HCM39802.1 hypothetical protein [Bdellovibrionales bacterium]
MANRISSLLLLPLILLTPAMATTPALIEVDRLEEATLYFRATEGIVAPPPLKTDLLEPKILGTIHDQTPATPYFVLSGRSSPGGETQIFVVRPKTKSTHFVFPGKIFDPKTRATLLDSRAFVGRCLKTSPHSVYVVFQRERIDRRHQMQPSVFLAEAGEDHLRERLLERGFPRISDTLKLVKAKVCREIEGKNRLMLRKPLDLTPRRGMNDDDDDEDEDEKKDTEPKEAEPKAAVELKT